MANPALQQQNHEVIEIDGFKIVCYYKGNDEERNKAEDNVLNILAGINIDEQYTDLGGSGC
ncbi:hypothetical protein [Vallitalea sp.]|jgi:hypothetical protein|uniref:hypothetical protein n=1 Tax=Vallitalea sp. TaxID=1882829 RepID=UPI0025E7D4B6|nr:hypothetical protein [Vallitalea sp.]MCT4686588.1 hypothetical protein [Vallitalea sp.]